MVFAYLEFRQGSSSKFWEMDVAGSTTTTRYGRIGASGVVKAMDHADPAAAAAYALKMTAAKRKKGYKDATPAGVGAGAGAGAGAGGTKKAPAKRATKKPAARGKKVAAGSVADTNVRLECITGGSSKFWEIAVAGDDDGGTTTVTYGKIGSAGSTQVKQFPSLAAANAAAGKLVKQKMNKGYMFSRVPPTTASAPTAITKDSGGKRKRAAGASAAASKKAATGGGQGLDGCVICLTGTCSMARKDMVALIEGAGGVFAKSVTAKTTHLLLAPGGHDTTKHAQAKGRGLEIVDEAWVVARASGGGGSNGGKEESEDEGSDGDDAASADGGASNGLDGCVICLTGTCSMPRKDMVALIEGAGGVFAKSVTAKTTHLLLAPGGHDTTKHAQAMGRGLEIVDEAWVVARASGSGGGAGGGGADVLPYDVEGESGDNAVKDVAAWKAKLLRKGAPQELVEQLEENLRPTLLPVVQAGDPGITDDKFAGTPYMEPNDEWPSCQCGKKMTFFFQCNLGKLPSKFHKQTGKGLLQLFICDELCGFDPDEKYYFARIVKAPKKSVKKEHVKVPATDAVFTPKTIVTWEERLDSVHSEDHDTVGITARAGDDDAVCDMLGEHARPFASEKLFGHPDWCQGAEWGACSKCDQRMHVLVQLNGNHFDDFLFGDCGTAHLFQCDEHHDELSFGWACG